MAEDKSFPPQRQERQPGREHEMVPEPEVIRDSYRGSGKLQGKVAVVTGGDSGIGRAVAVHFAREGAKLMVAYLEEEKDAEETRRLVKAENQPCSLFRGDLGDPEVCENLVQSVVDEHGRIDVLVNNGAEQHEMESLEEVTPEHWDRVFRTNIHAYFYVTRSAVRHMGEGAAIINTTSVNAYKGHKKLIAYTATKGAIVGLTRSLSLVLADRGIRVNGVAPGPVWTPLIPASFTEGHVEKFGENVPMGRAGQPSEVAPSYVFLASQDASFISGQVLHPNGGVVVNG